MTCPKQKAIKPRAQSNRPHTQELFYFWVINISHSLLKYISVLSINRSALERNSIERERERERDTQHQHEDEDENSQIQICLSASLSLLFRDLVRYRLGRWKTEDTQMLVSEFQGLGSRVLSLEVLTKRYLLWQRQESLRSHSGATGVSRTSLCPVAHDTEKQTHFWSDSRQNSCSSL